MIKHHLCLQKYNGRFLFTKLRLAKPLVFIQLWSGVKNFHLGKVDFELRSQRFVDYTRSTLSELDREFHFVEDGLGALRVVEGC